MLKQSKNLSKQPKHFFQMCKREKVAWQFVFLFSFPLIVINLSLSSVHFLRNYLSYIVREDSLRRLCTKAWNQFWKESDMNVIEAITLLVIASCLLFTKELSSGFWDFLIKVLLKTKRCPRCTKKCENVHFFVHAATLTSIDENKLR